MRKILLIWLLVLNVSCKNESKSVTVEETLQETVNFDWLVGNWQRTNEREDRETFENWNKTNDTLYKGYGYTLEDNDTIWQENIKLVKEGVVWNFEVMGKGEARPTIFELTQIDQERFTCENQENEFPNLITYFKNGDGINAVISGGDMEIPYEFKRIGK